MIYLGIIFLVYILTILFLAFFEWCKNREECYTIGDIINRMVYAEFIPIINTVVAIAVIFCVIGLFIWEVLKLNKLWEKFMNIKIKQP